MAKYKVAVSKHAVLTANETDTVSFSSDPSQVEVLNRNYEGELWFRVDGIAPVVAGDNTRVVMPGTSLVVGLGHGDAIQLTADVDVTYSVTGI